LTTKDQSFFLNTMANIGPQLIWSTPQTQMARTHEDSSTCLNHLLWRKQKRTTLDAIHRKQRVVRASLEKRVDIISAAHAALVALCVFEKRATRKSREKYAWVFRGRCIQTSQAILWRDESLSEEQNCDSCYVQKFNDSQFCCVHISTSSLMMFSSGLDWKMYMLCGWKWRCLYNRRRFQIWNTALKSGLLCVFPYIAFLQYKAPAAFVSFFKRLSIEPFDIYNNRRLLRWTGHVARLPLIRAPRKILTSWVDNPRPLGCPQIN
jgi:hypothetical protein